MIPEDCWYSKDHEWFRLEGDECTVGITDFAQDELGEVVFVELPDVGASFTAEDELGSVESVKAVSEIFTALDGTVVAVNEALADKPELINEDPHGDGWLVRLKLAHPGETGDLMNAEEYARHIEGGS